jgi:glycosyltransferase involved in cell wall biosynthesis
VTDEKLATLSRVAVLPVTAIVASHNEAHLLPQCLEALTFCDELIVVDIDSRDDTAAVARRFGATVLRHPYIAIADGARPEAIAMARHDWLLVRDPDEIVPPALRAQLIELLPGLDPAVGLITGPIQYYFGGRPLRGTTWGGIQHARVLARRDLVTFPTTVHGKLVRRQGCLELAIPFSGDNAIAHYWADGYGDVLEKHRRYLRLEGRARAVAGEATSVRRILAVPFSEFQNSFVARHGYRDGLRGLLLSIVWSLYRTGAQVALLRELRRRRSAAAVRP